MSIQDPATTDSNLTNLNRNLSSLSLISSTPYVWPKLTSDNSTRVLQLKPAESVEDDLRCRLVEITIREPPHTISNTILDNEDSIPSSQQENGPLATVQPSDDAANLPVFPFEAISYACGDFHPSIPLYIDGDCHTLITSNLASALRCLRLPSTDRLLWVDTVCIHQSDNEEKSRHVAIMHKIYRQATRVQIWLGVSDDKTKEAFCSIKTIAEECEFYNVRTGELFQQLTPYDPPQLAKIRDLIYDDTKGGAILSILQRDYFRRRWIIQETTLARSLTINCGIETLPWDTFAQFIAVIRVCINVIPAAQLGDLWLANMPHTPAFAMLHTRHQHQRHVRNLQSEVHSSHHNTYSHPSNLNLLSLLKEYSHTLCRSDHDLVYALLGAADDIHQPFLSNLKPNYSLPIENLFHDFALAYLCDAQDVRILHHVRDTKTPELPSFVPDWRVPHKTEHLSSYIGGWHDFCAGIGDDSMNQPPQILSSINTNSPVVLGWYVDSILATNALFFPPGEGWDRVYPPQLAAWHLFTWFRVYNNHRAQGIEFYAFTHEPIFGAFVRTMVCDNQLARTKAYLADKREIEWLMNQLDEILTALEDFIIRPPKPNPEPGDDCDDDEDPASTSPSLLDAGAYIRSLLAKSSSSDNEVRIPADHNLNFLLAVAAMIQERAFFVTTNNLIGIGPCGSDVGDVIALVAGAETPFVLRPVKEEQDEDNDEKGGGGGDDGGGEDKVHGEAVEKEKKSRFKLSLGKLEVVDGSSEVKDYNGDDQREEHGERWTLPDPEEEHTNTYTVVGECYVHGIMDGFFTKFAERSRMFTLR